MNDQALSLNFRSDNVVTVTPEVLRALRDVNHGPAASYGDDKFGTSLKRKFGELFETELTVFPVATATAANAFSPQFFEAGQVGPGAGRGEGARQ
jgi:threonine aldolase